MSTPWRPMKSEPDPLSAALYDYLRERVPAVLSDGITGARPLGRGQTTLPDGTPLVTELQIVPAAAHSFNQRDAFIFDVHGQTAAQNGGHSVEGKVIIDRRTHAFLHIEVETTILNTAGHR